MLFLDLYSFILENIDFALEKFVEISENCSEIWWKNFFSQLYVLNCEIKFNFEFSTILLSKTSLPTIMNDTIVYDKTK